MWVQTIMHFPGEHHSYHLPFDQVPKFRISFCGYQIKRYFTFISNKVTNFPRKFKAHTEGGEGVQSSVSHL